MSHRVEYDAVAPHYDRRYAVHEYGGVEACITQFVAQRSTAPAPPAAVLEVGCGTGHWLGTLTTGGHPAAGIDPSRGMLARARHAAPEAALAQAAAEALPWRSATFDRVLVVNALHHFRSPTAFFAEARRVLRPGGGLLTIGLDPHTGEDQWWIYDYFPSARAADQRRYLPASRIRDGLVAAGFGGARSWVAQHWPAAISVADAEAQGLLDRQSTSQLLVISDAEYEAGLARIRATRASPGAGPPLLRGDLRVYATAAWLPTDPGAAA